MEFYKEFVDQREPTPVALSKQALHWYKRISTDVIKI